MDIDRKQDPYTINSKALANWTIGMLGSTSQSKLAKALGSSPQSVQRWRRGEIQQLYQEQIEAIAKLTRQSFDDILQMLHAERKVQIFNDFIRPNVCLPADFIYIPIYDIGAGAGNGVNPVSETVISTLAFDRVFLQKRFGAASEKLEGIRIIGDSMDPTLQHGDIVLVDRSDLTVRDGIFLIRVEGDLLVKRLSMVGHMIQLISDNTFYPVVNLDPAAQDFDVLGRVCMRCQNL